MKKRHTLTQDNGSCNGHKKLTVEIEDSILVWKLKKFFGWRKDVTASRLCRLGSSQYDLFIKNLSESGY
jgi:hypothetical protein